MLCAVASYNYTKNIVKKRSYGILIKFLYRRTFTGRQVSWR